MSNPRSPCDSLWAVSWRSAIGMAVVVTSMYAAGPSTQEVTPMVVSETLPGYKLIWADNFDGDTLNAAEWSYRLDSKHWSTQRAKNVSVRDGALHIALRKEKAEDKEYTGGGVISKRRFKHGYYEARMKMPPGKGWHTSFWTMGYRQDKTAIGDVKIDVPMIPPVPLLEIDICEQDSINKNGYNIAAHRYQPAHAKLGGQKIQTPDLSVDFHVFGCEFTERELRFFFDGKLVATKDVSQVEQGEHSIWLTAIASSLGRTDRVDDEALPSDAIVDWVRFHEKAE